MTAAAGTSLLAQLNVVTKSDQIQVYTVDNALPYDSLTNLENYAALPGQTLFMSGIKNSSRGYVDTFFNGNFLTEKPTIYGTENTFASTPAEMVEGKYFDVIKVWLKPGPMGRAACCMLLKEKESGEEVYYKPTLYSGAMTCVGFYEKLKRHIGQPFLSLAQKVETLSGEKIVPDEGKEYRCVDIMIEMNADGPVLVMEDSDGQRVKGHPSGRAVYEFVSLGDIDDSVKRFGKKFGRDIAMRHVVPGMTTEMVISAWGEPFQKSSVEDKGSAREYWRFSQDRSLSIENGIVVRVYQ
ncbi:MAG: hypothetical protein K2K93_00245 [Muribaculaceae bacterium]|nr:hypothetical protein [Muribaculaceae bacterium]